MRRIFLLTAGGLALAMLPIMISAQSPAQAPLQPEQELLGPPMFDDWPGMGQGLGPGMQRGRGFPFGRGHGRGFGPRMGRGLSRGLGQHLSLGWVARDPALRERLGITEEQASKIQSAQSRFVKQQIQHRADLRVKRMELAELMRAENPDRAAIEKKLREVNELELQGRLAGVDHHLAMRNMLTPEQREQLKQLVRERMQQRFRGRRGLGPGPQRGPGAGSRGLHPPQPQPPPAE